MSCSAVPKRPWSPISFGLRAKSRCGSCAWTWLSVYRSIVRKHFPKAVIVADRFHVIRLVNHHFLACWREIDPAGAKNRGLLSLMRRHRHNLKPEQKLRLMAYLAERPALDVIYRFKQRLCYLLLKKHKCKRQCQKLIPALSARGRRIAPIRTAATRRPGRNAPFLVGGDRAHVALHAVQRNHRRVSQQNGNDQQAGVRLPQLRKLPSARAGVMFLERSGIGGCPRNWRRALPPLLAYSQGLDLAPRVQPSSEQAFGESERGSILRAVNRKGRFRRRELQLIFGCQRTRWTPMIIATQHPKRAVLQPRCGER